MKIWYFHLGIPDNFPNVDYYCRLYGSTVIKNKSVTFVPAKNLRSALQGSFGSSAPVNVLVRSRDMKIMYVAAGYRSQSKANLMNKIQQLLNAP